MDKLSPLAQFDDFCRFQNSISNNAEVVYKEFLKVVKCCEKIRSKWMNTKEELKESKRKILQLKTVNSELINSVKFLKNKLEEQTIISQKTATELVKLRMKINEFNQSTNVLLKTANHDLDILKNKQNKNDFDLTEDQILHEQLVARLNRLRSTSDEDEQQSEKLDNKKKQTVILDTNSTTSFTSNYDGDEEGSEQKFPKYDHDYQFKRNNYDYDKKVTAYLVNVVEETETDDQGSTANENATVIEYKSTTPEPKSTNLELIPQSTGKETVYYTPARQIDYVPSRLNFGQSDGGSASPSSADNNSFGSHHWQHLIMFNRSRLILCPKCCNQIDFFGSYVHCTECGISLHNECINDFNCSCVSNHKDNPRALMDFVALNELLVDSKPKPLVAEILLKCCGEIEKRGLRIENIYLVPKPDRIVRNLMLDFLYPSCDYERQQQLARTEIHLLCNVVLYFLGYLIDLKDPLIAEFVWNDLQTLIDEKMNDSIKSVKEIIAQLPTVNRQTLAYLMIHLRKVIKNENRNHVSLDSLAKMFSSKVIVYPEISSNKINDDQKYKEIQCKIMKRLLSTSSDVWMEILNETTPESSPGSSDKTYEKRSYDQLTIGANYHKTMLFQSPISYKSTSVYGTPIH